MKTLLQSDFDSEAEFIYYEWYILPGLKNKSIQDCQLHQEFEILPAIEFNGKTVRAKMYKPDFVLTMKDGSTQVIEVKSGFVKRSERDYSLRRHLFLMSYCIPNHWSFLEVNADQIMKSKRQLRKIGRLAKKQGILTCPAKRVSSDIGPITKELWATYGSICTLSFDKMKRETALLRKNPEYANYTVVDKEGDALILVDTDDNIYSLQKKLKNRKQKVSEYVVSKLEAQVSGNSP